MRTDGPLGFRNNPGHVLRLGALISFALVPLLCAACPVEQQDGGGTEVVDVS